MSVSSLSAGRVIRKILTEDEGVKAFGVTKVFPVVTDNALLPYIAYRRTSLEAAAVKQRADGSPAGWPDTTAVEIICFAQDYEGSVSLAEAVRAALDGKQAIVDNLRMRSCMMTDSEETFQDDAYVQRMVFTIKVS